MSPIKIVECPRDAIQGIQTFIPTEKKADYINQLLKVGFDTLDFGSFVSPKVMPQMRDTMSVLNRLKLDETLTKLLAIVANVKGAESACQFDEIRYLGYPFSVSETFQQRNTRKSIEESFEVVLQIKNLCEMHGKELVIYISMAFGNPYNDLYDEAIVAHWIDRLVAEGIEIISLADTVGLAEPKQINSLFGLMSNDFHKTEFGVHLHTTHDNWQAKLEAAFDAGCLRFDGAIKGFGGCPFAKDELVGNLATENLIQFLTNKAIDLKLDQEEFVEAMSLSNSVYSYK